MMRKVLKRILTATFIRQFKPIVRNYIPRRALLYVPADDLKKLLKAFVVDDVDCIILDCEDSVPINRKPQARLNIKNLLAAGKPQRNRNYELIVRVNAVHSGILKEDLYVIFSGEQLPDTIFLPKVETVDDLEKLADLLKEGGSIQSKLGLMLGIETALSVVNLVDICRKAEIMANTETCATPVALLFGSENFHASIGAKKSKLSDEIIYARQKLVTVAKAFNLHAIDSSYMHFQDNEGLKEQAEQAARMGFSGKQIIHPGQIQITQIAFLPTEKEIQWAQSIMKAYSKHEKEGRGIFTFRGSLIDMPTVRQAQNILELVNAIMIQDNK